MNKIISAFGVLFVLTLSLGGIACATSDQRWERGQIEKQFYNLRELRDPLPNDTCAWLERFKVYEALRFRLEKVNLDQNLQLALKAVTFSAARRTADAAYVALTNSGKLGCGGRESETIANIEKIWVIYWNGDWREITKEYAGTFEISRRAVARQEVRSAVMDYTKGPTGEKKFALKELVAKTISSDKWYNPEWLGVPADMAKDLGF
ncbi:hypothetical protein H0W91_03960 [Patescibacteria group bacterium]|nr:hypothetical protein [Patescibacteria group bacterium]